MVDAAPAAPQKGAAEMATEGAVASEGAPELIDESLLAQAELSWAGFAVGVGALLALLFARRLLQADQARRGRTALLMLVLGLIARLVAIPVGLAGAATVAGFLNVVTILFTAFGITGLVSMLLFDIGARRVRVKVAPVAQDLLQAAAFIIIAFLVLRTAGVNVLSLVTTSAVLTAVIGLALQGTIANLFAGLSLQMDRTISVGDWIQVSSWIGRVTNIKWRSTFMITRDGDNVIIPNAQMISSEVLNYSKPSLERRQTVTVGIHYKHPPNQVKQILVDAIRGCPGILTDLEPDVVVTEFADSAVNYGVRYWIRDTEREPEISSEVRTRIWYATMRAGLDIPFPIRTVQMTQVTEESLGRAAAEEHERRRETLKRIDIFAPLEDADRDLLATGLRSESFAAGEAIIRQGAAGDSLYVINEGEVAVRLSVDGAEREVAKLSAGNFFGEMSLMTGEPRRATVAARSDVTCYVVGHDAFQTLLEARPQVAEQMSKVLARRQAELEGERENLSAEAKARRAAEASTKLLAKIRDFFHLG